MKLLDLLKNNVNGKEIALVPSEIKPKAFLKMITSLTLAGILCVPTHGCSRTESDNKSFITTCFNYAGKVMLTGGVTFVSLLILFGAEMELFGNKVLWAAERLADEIKKSKPNEKLLYWWCKDFFEALIEATGYQGEDYCEGGMNGLWFLEEKGTNLGQPNYAYGNKDTLVTDIKELISRAIPDTNKKVKVNRLRSVDPDTLKRTLLSLFDSCCKSPL